MSDPYTGAVVAVPKAYYDALVEASLILEAFPGQFSMLHNEPSGLRWQNSRSKALEALMAAMPKPTPSSGSAANPSARGSSASPEQGPGDAPLEGLGREPARGDGGSGLLVAPPLDTEFSFPLDYSTRLLDVNLTPAQRDRYVEAIRSIERPPKTLNLDLRHALTKVAQERAGILDAFLAALIAAHGDPHHNPPFNPTEWTLVEEQNFQGDRLRVAYHLERQFSRRL